MHIRAAQDAVKKAQKDMLEARRKSRNERRKKARLIKRASGLTPEDLERMAVLKRCGLWDPSMTAVAPLQPRVARAGPAAAVSVLAAAGSAASASGSAVAVAERVDNEEEAGETNQDGDKASTEHSDKEEGTE